jgi:alpha-galactosidase
MEHERVDILAKPLQNGDIAVSFINLSNKDTDIDTEIRLEDIKTALAGKMSKSTPINESGEFVLRDLWSGEKSIISDGCISVKSIKAHDNMTFRISAI